MHLPPPFWLSVFHVLTVVDFSISTSTSFSSSSSSSSSSSKASSSAVSTTPIPDNSSFPISSHPSSLTLSLPKNNISLVSSDEKPFETFSQTLPSVSSSVSSSASKHDAEASSLDSSSEADNLLREAKLATGRRQIDEAALRHRGETEVEQTRQDDNEAALQEVKGKESQQGDRNSKFESKVNAVESKANVFESKANAIELISGININGEQLEKEVVSQVQARVWKRISEEHFSVDEDFDDSMEKDRLSALREAKIYAAFDQIRDNSTQLSLSSFWSTFSSSSLSEDDEKSPGPKEFDASIVTLLKEFLKEALEELMFMVEEEIAAEEAEGEGEGGEMMEEKNGGEEEKKDEEEGERKEEEEMKEAQTGNGILTSLAPLVRLRRAVRSQQLYRRGRQQIKITNKNTKHNPYYYNSNDKIEKGVLVKLNKTTVRKEDCPSICPGHRELEVPNCGDRRVEPDFHEVCGCITRYHCCPHTCPKVDRSKCKKGKEFAVEVKDCCSCANVRCDPCPKKKAPKCNPDCEVEDVARDKSTGCRYPICKVVCPSMDTPVNCPECYMATTVQNESLCNCMVTKCVKGMCPPVNKLAPRECQMIKTIKNSCGCQIQIYDSQSFCEEHNKAAANFQCKDSCFKPVVLKGQGRCGCDKAECERLDEHCRETFEDATCPAGSRKRTGTTPCGTRRDICLKCDVDVALGLDEVSCNRKCHNVVNKTNDDGCTFSVCQKKPCERVRRLKDCGNCQVLDTYLDFCGCVVGRCVKKCPKIPLTACKPGFVMGVDPCGCPSGVCAPSKILAKALCDNKGFGKTKDQKCPPAKRFSDCGPCEVLDTETSKSGCIIAKCIKKCKRIDKSTCNQGFTMKRDYCGCLTGVCIPGKPLDQLFRSAIKHSVYRETKTNWYLIVKISQSFYLAQSFCRAIPGADLASVETPDEFKYLQAELKKISATYYWIGGYRTNARGWIWSASEKAIRWFKWHPSNSRRINEYGIAWHPSNQGWTDQPKQQDYFFICEATEPITSTP